MKKKLNSNNRLIYKFLYKVSILTFITCIILVFFLFFLSLKTKNQIKDIQAAYNSSDTFQSKPTGNQGESDMLPEFSKLIELNPETIGWISIPNTNINMAVVKKDDKSIGNTHYLNHDFYNKYSKSGTLFMDYRNSILRDECSDNLIIYGHNRLDNTMFGDLTKYKSLDFYKDNTEITFSTLYSKDKYVIVSCFDFNSNLSSKDSFNYIDHINFSSKDDFSNYLNEIRSRSLITNDVDVVHTDKLLTLSTCTNEYDGARFVVVLRKVRANEENPINLNSIKLN